METTLVGQAHRRLRLAVSLVALMACASTAIAEVDSASNDDKGYSGAGCAAGAGRSSDLVTTRQGEVYNKNTGSSLDVICPVILDRVGPSLDVSLFLKKATAGTVNCFVHSRYDDGSGGTVKTGSASGTGTKIVYIAGVSHFSTATAGCALPAATSTAASGRTGIVSYFGYEY